MQPPGLWLQDRQGLALQGCGYLETAEGWWGGALLGVQKDQRNSSPPCFDSTPPLRDLLSVSGSVPVMFPMGPSLLSSAQDKCQAGVHPKPSNLSPQHCPSKRHTLKGQRCLPKLGTAHQCSFTKPSPAQPTASTGPPVDSANFLFPRCYDNLRLPYVVLALALSQWRLWQAHQSRLKHHCSSRCPWRGQEQAHSTAQKAMAQAWPHVPDPARKLPATPGIPATTTKGWGLGLPLISGAPSLCAFLLVC